MCGFCGYVNNYKNIENDIIISKMVETIKKRGPNAQNVFINKNVALGHARLSIIDVANGNQPMIKDVNNKKYVIVYNGELYNTKEIRNGLLSKGYNFLTKWDTEVVFNSFIEYGKDCVSLLNGIFSFVAFEFPKMIVV